ncbi:MAG TPA: hypothetical protein VL362_00965 [Patescibacteria group bacterium]|nr:hypothetical protein [Patescibacteria group bacterium]
MRRIDVGTAHLQQYRSLLLVAVIVVCLGMLLLLYGRYTHRDSIPRPSFTPAESTHSDTVSVKAPSTALLDSSQVATSDSKTQQQTVSVHTSQQVTGKTHEQEAEVTVNGQKVNVPESGHVHKVVRSGSQKTTLDISSQSQSSSSVDSSIDIAIDSSTEREVEH